MASPYDPKAIKKEREDAKTFPGPIGDILTHLEKVDEDIDILEAHAKAAIEHYERLSRLFAEQEVRLKLVESKTYSLAINPGRRPCPSCGRLLPNPNALKCPLCGAPIPQ